MGQKVHPIGIRLGVVKKHNANWYANPKQYSEYLINDIQVREYLRKKLDSAMISKIMIERPTGAAKITIATARPGIVIGKKGEDIERLQKELTKIMGVPAQVNIEEITSPDLDAHLVAEGIASQLERRVMFRRAMKRAVQNSMRSGAKGIKVELSGRLGGSGTAGCYPGRPCQRVHDYVRRFRQHKGRRRGRTYEIVHRQRRRQDLHADDPRGCRVRQNRTGTAGGDHQETFGVHQEPGRYGGGYQSHQHRRVGDGRSDDPRRDQGQARCPPTGSDSKGRRFEGNGQQNRRHPLPRQ